MIIFVPNFKHYFMLRIGIFGVGHLGKFHLNNWKQIEGVTIVGFYDPYDETARQVEESYQIRRFTDAAELMEAIDAADIVAPTHLHFSLCEMAIRLGKHVFVEKPMCDTMEQAQEVVKLVREAGVKFQVGHVERFNPAFLAIKDLELNPMFIEVHRLAQFNPRGTEVSVILDLMIHDIDIILHLVKSDVKQVHANGVAVMTDTPDIANVRIEFDNGCVANLTSSRISMKKCAKSGSFKEMHILESTSSKRKPRLFVWNRKRETPMHLHLILKPAMEKKPLPYPIQQCQKSTQLN